MPRGSNFCAQAGADGGQWRGFRLEHQQRGAGRLAGADQCGMAAERADGGTQVGAGIGYGSPDQPAAPIIDRGRSLWHAGHDARCIRGFDRQSPDIVVAALRWLFDIADRAPFCRDLVGIGRDARSRPCPARSSVSCARR